MASDGGPMSFANELEIPPNSFVDIAFNADAMVIGERQRMAREKVSLLCRFGEPRDISLHIFF